MRIVVYSLATSSQSHSPASERYPECEVTVLVLSEPPAADLLP